MMYVFLAVTTLFAAASIALLWRYATVAIAMLNESSAPHGYIYPIIKFAGKVPESDRADIEAQILAHHAALPPSHEAKGAIFARVNQSWHRSGWGGHVRFDYHSGYPRGSNKLGKTHKIYKPLSVIMGSSVPEEQRSGIIARVHAHHASLPECHEAKLAKAARVGEGWHTSVSDQEVHLTVRYHSGYPRHRNKIGIAHHIVLEEKPVDRNDVTRERHVVGMMQLS